MINGLRPLASASMFAAPVFAVLLTFAAAQPAGAAPAAELWERWRAHDPGSAMKLDHQDWTEVLRDVTTIGADGVRRVDYQRIRAERWDRLNSYIARMEAVSVSRLSRPEQLAFWINLYNALTVRVVTEHFPVASIRDIDISPGWFSDGPWGAALATVEGEAVTLDDIEHRILRPIWQEPLVHYAVNCASIGCPDLAPEAYQADTIEQQLEAAARRFINHPRGAVFEDGALTVSKIYRWFEDDFETSDKTGAAAVIAHLKHYADPPLSDALSQATSISDYAYDWQLNGL